MKPENRALAVMGLAVVVLVGVGFTAVYFLGGSAPLPTVLVPSGSFALSSVPSSGGPYATAFAYSNNRTASYTVAGAWRATGPVQVIVGELVGLNRAGCGFSPLNYPPGPPINGCWPAFNETPEGAFEFAFHICVSADTLPTGGFLIVFRSTGATTVTVTHAFVVQEMTFPQSSCPG